MSSQKQALELLLDAIDHGRKLQYEQHIIGDYENERIESFLFHAVNVLQDKDSKDYILLNEYLKNLEVKTKKA